MNEIDEVDTKVKQYECVCSTVGDIRCWHANARWPWPADNVTIIPWGGGSSVESAGAQPIISLRPVSSAGETWNWHADPDYRPEVMDFYTDAYGVTEFITDGSYPF